jgi:hypothetical protein
MKKYPNNFYYWVEDSNKTVNIFAILPQKEIQSRGKKGLIKVETHACPTTSPSLKLKRFLNSL